MSERYPGGYITKTAPQPTGGESGTAPGVWTLEQAAEYQKAGNWPLPPQPVYVENVFSTYIYNGTGSAQTINNGIDLANKGGLVWTKGRNNPGYALYNALVDTVRGVSYNLYSNTTGPQENISDINSFGSNGYSFSSAPGGYQNNSGNNYVSWTFRKQPKFFDIVTYSGNETNRTIAHNLGSVPGCIIVKGINVTKTWIVYHSGIGAGNYLVLNSTAASASGGALFTTTPTSTSFSIGTGTLINETGVNYIAYLFASNSGGFGELATDNVISCGSFATNSSGIATVNLGYEPQWVLIKRTDGLSEWNILDNMRGFSTTVDAWLRANSSSEESTTNTIATPTATGFVTDGTNIIDPSSTFVYIAIRRGPMKTPTTGTSVFSLATRTGTGSATTTGSFGFPADMFYTQSQIGNVQTELFDKLRGGGVTGLQTTTTNAQGDRPCLVQFNTNQTAAYIAVSTDINEGSPYTYIDYGFRRAPQVFDIVCYTGTGSALTLNHNLTIAPELIITKRRNAFGRWPVWFKDWGYTDFFNYLELTQAPSNRGSDYITAVTSTTYSIGTDSTTYWNTSGGQYVSYLFGTCPGVSKVGSVNVTGAAINVDCGFTTGARFVMLKRTAGTSPWLYWDTARGIVAGNDPYLAFNSTSAQNFDGAADFIDPYSAGFTIAAGAIDGYWGSGTYIYLAIA